MADHTASSIAIAADRAAVMSVIADFDSYPAWAKAAAGDATDGTYPLSVDPGVPMIGMLRRKGERAITGTALKGLKARVESGAR